MSSPTGTTNFTTADVTYSTMTTPVAPVTTGVSVSVTASLLSDDDQAAVARLWSQITSQRYEMQLRDAYYRGEVRIQDLGISIPPQLRALHTVLGWPRVAVDALEERLDLNGFRLPDSDDVDTDLQEIFQANDMDAEHHMSNIDALVLGRSYVTVGAGDSSDMPLLAVESPLDMAVEWDARLRTVVRGLRVFGPVGHLQATYYKQGRTLPLAQSNGAWVITDTPDEYDIPECLIVPIPNRSRSYDRFGQSEITPEIMSTTDRASRTLLGLEVAREFYSAPQRYIIGAAESAFQDSSGNPLSAWSTYMGRVLGLERDEEGQVPTVGQFTPYNPDSFTKLIDMDARIMSSLTGLPPHVLGYTTDNPASADAIRSAEMRLKLKADRKTTTFGPRWCRVMKLALQVRGGPLPDKIDQMVSVWADTATPTPAATTDSVFKQVQMGYLPATSDVTGEKLGYSPTERSRIEKDRAKDPAMSELAELATSLQAKLARADVTVSKDINPAAVNAAQTNPATGTAAVVTPPAPQK